MSESKEQINIINELDQQKQVLKTEIGSVTCHVEIHLNTEARETLPDKLRNMLWREVRNEAYDSISSQVSSF